MRVASISTARRIISTIDHRVFFFLISIKNIRIWSNKKTIQNA
jgi:hypothetical protein